MPVTFTIAPGYEQATLKLLRKLPHYARTEPGILEGKYNRSHTEPRRFFAYLQFTDQVTLDAHRGSGDYGEYVMSNLSGMLEKDGPTIETYEPLFGQETVSWGSDLNLLTGLLHTHEGGGERQWRIKRFELPLTNTGRPPQRVTWTPNTRFTRMTSWVSTPSQAGG